MDEKVADQVAWSPAPATPEPVPGSSIPKEELEQLTADIVAALKTVYDPEIPADIYELGLIYKIDVDDGRNVAVEMTLTSPGLSRGGRNAGLGGERHRLRRRRRPGHGQAHVRPALGQGAACPTRPSYSLVCIEGRKLGPHVAKRTHR